MTVDRFLDGNHPTRGSGIWLSQNGVDVKSAADANMLLNSSIKKEQIFQTGAVGLPSSGTVNVPWIDALSSVPIVFFQWSDVFGQTYLPFNPSSFHPTSFNLRAIPSTTGCVFSNGDSIAKYIVYAAFYRSLT